jgi:hypothetical protein
MDWGLLLASSCCIRVARTSSGSGTPSAAGSDHSGDGIASRADQHLKCAVSSRSAAEMTRQRRASPPRDPRQKCLSLSLSAAAPFGVISRPIEPLMEERARLRLGSSNQVVLSSAADVLWEAAILGLGSAACLVDFGPGSPRLMGALSRSWHRLWTIKCVSLLGFRT